MGEDGDDVAFGEVKGETADVDVGCVVEVAVPGAPGGDIVFEFALVEGLDFPDGVHDGGCWDMASEARGNILNKLGLEIVRA